VSGTSPFSTSPLTSFTVDVGPPTSPPPVPTPGLAADGPDELVPGREAEVLILGAGLTTGTAALLDMERIVTPTLGGTVAASLSSAQILLSRRSSRLTYGMVAAVQRPAQANGTVHPTYTISILFM
jgi:hypothetical protein